MKAFVFPGQASQYVGMAADLHDQFAVARRYFNLADEVLGIPLRKTCFEGPQETLTRTEFTQPAIFVHSAIIDEILRQEGIRPAMTAGHSLGEYSALVAAGAISFEDGLKAVKARSSYMQICCDKYPGTMAAIVGMSLREVEKGIAGIDGVVPANYNSPDQVAISGKKDAVEAACAKLLNLGAKRAIPLSVGGAYHSPLMAEAKTMMADIIESLEFRKFECPVVANVSAQPVDDAVTMKRLLVEQIISPVLWYPSVVKMYEKGIREFVEVGPGKVLQGLIKRCLSGKDYRAYGIDKFEDIQKTSGVVA